MTGRERACIMFMENRTPLCMSLNVRVGLGSGSGVREGEGGGVHCQDGSRVRGGQGSGGGRGDASSGGIRGQHGQAHGQCRVSPCRVSPCCAVLLGMVLKVIGKVGGLLL